MEATVDPQPRGPDWMPITPKTGSLLHADLHTNAIESLIAVLRKVCCNVKRWRDARMALRWTGTAMLEAEKSFRRLKAYKQLPILRTALLRHQQSVLGDKLIATKNLVA